VERPSVVTIYRLGFGALALAAIGYQFLDLAAGETLNPVNFFSYFTIQSNLIGVAALFLAAAAPSDRRRPRVELVRGAAVVYLTVTLVVFALLLSGTNVDTAVPWVNTVVHRVFPIVVLADWLIDPPSVAISFRRSLVWLVYPLVWVGYTLVRGAATGWYPYPFINPANGGYATVAVYIGVIVAFGVLLCGVVSTLGNALGRRRVPAPPIV
jgi:hypothetical protein